MAGIADIILDGHGPEGKRSGAADDLGDDMGGQQMDLKMMFKALGVEIGKTPNWSKAVDCFNSFIGKVPDDEPEDDKGEGDEPDDDHDIGN